jgi:hypothetical protein
MVEINQMLDELARFFFYIFFELSANILKLMIKWDSFVILLKYMRRGVLVKWSDKENLYCAYRKTDPDEFEFGETHMSALIRFLTKYPSSDEKD